ncbi:MAG TPA: hypothetical protein DIT13_10430 [Verrucomicrobiales bacterium]|nr:hypothetical protein [Verrucomicrobiales bacterium]HRJ07416.1 hypothetical protein [Prosthecobacter sp.]HRK12705.1 hypothetical protein [Prosthecobacter sp.]
MIPRFTSLILAAAILAGLSSCKTMTSDPVVIGDSPVTYRLVSEIVDEETLEHSVKFRNIGQQVVSFDYTLADDASVPHLDCLGPNSGLVENLYPGAEATVKNTLGKSRGVHVVLGRITAGKKSGEQLARVYKPSTLPPPMPASGSGGLLPLPTLDSASTSSE